MIALGVGLVALLILGFYVFDWTSNIGSEVTVATAVVLTAVIGGLVVRWQADGDSGYSQPALVVFVLLLIGMALGWSTGGVDDDESAGTEATSTTDLASSTTTTEPPMTDDEREEFFEELDGCFTTALRFAYDAGFDEGYEVGLAAAEGLSIRPPPDDYAPDGTPVSPRARAMSTLRDQATWPCSATPPPVVDGVDLDRVVLFRQLEDCYDDGVSDAYSVGYEDGYPAGESDARGVGASMDEDQRSASLAQLHDAAAFPCG